MTRISRSAPTMRGALLVSACGLRCTFDPGPCLEAARLGRVLAPLCWCPSYGSLRLCPLDAPVILRPDELVPPLALCWCHAVSPPLLVQAAKPCLYNLPYQLCFAGSSSARLINEALVISRGYTHDKRYALLSRPVTRLGSFLWCHALCSFPLCWCLGINPTHLPGCRAGHFPSMPAVLRQPLRLAGLNTRPGSGTRSDPAAGISTPSQVSGAYDRSLRARFPLWCRLSLSCSFPPLFWFLPML